MFTPPPSPIQNLANQLLCMFSATVTAETVVGEKGATTACDRTPKKNDWCEEEDGKLKD